MTGKTPSVIVDKLPRRDFISITVFINNAHNKVLLVTVLAEMVISIAAHQKETFSTMHIDVSHAFLHTKALRRALERLLA